jgi:triphosphoribosyl-dephospho-CoA synthase
MSSGVSSAPPERRFVATLQRHQLARLTPQGWQTLLDEQADPRVRHYLKQWAQQDLPLVVTRQPDTLPTDQLALGWPAPSAMGRLRVPLRVARHQVVQHDGFPLAHQILPLLDRSAATALKPFLDQLMAWGTRPRVYGSFGWQWLTGMAYVHGQSDLDLLLVVDDACQADAVSHCLMQHGPPGLRLDGELLFPDGRAVAWREWFQARRSPVRTVLVKSLQGCALGSKHDWPGARWTQTVGRAAVLALHDELTLTPKPGLVTPEDNGSHHDMNAHTFMRSLFSLRGYFRHMAQLGVNGAAFSALESAGLQAEQRMGRATGGVNTHRGAIFTLGLLAAAAGATKSQPQTNGPAGLRQQLIHAWGQALHERSHQVSALPGGQAARRYGLRGAADEAAAGFPVLFECALPAMQAALRRGMSTRLAQVDTFFHIMARIDDCNLAHRGGLAGLQFAREHAMAFLADGGAAQDNALVRAQQIGREFVARRLSPGASADMLAAVCLLVRLFPDHFPRGSA